jgi:hypothetical protein
VSLCYVSVVALIGIGLPKCSPKNRASFPIGDKNDNSVKLIKLDKKEYVGLSDATFTNAQSRTTAAAISTAKKANEPSRVFVGTDLDEEWILNRLASEPPKGFISVGNTSVVFKMSFETPPDAAFKPAAWGRPKGHVAEIAAYRLGRCLGINNIPPTISTRIDRKTLRGGLSIKQTTVWHKLDARIKWNEDGSVQGAAIYWVPAMRNLNLESRREMRRWLRWLDIGGEVSEDVRPLAKDISNMLSFDYLIGNGDRFSGGNIKGDPQGRFLFFRDHDLSFPSKLSDRVHRRIANRMLLAKRFSRGFFHNLRMLTRKRFQDELERDPMSAKGPLLDDRQLAGLFDRREALLSHITSLIQLYGMDRVLVFP